VDAEERKFEPVREREIYSELDSQFEQAGNERFGTEEAHFLGGIIHK